MFKQLFKKFSSTFQAQKCKAGELYSIPNHGQFGILKVLKVDLRGVHVCVYSNLYTKVPSKINEHELFIDSEDNLSTNHAPLTFSSIKLWKPSFLKSTKVKKEELRDYYSWKYNNHYYA